MNDIAEAPASIGHNRGPVSITEELTERHKSLLDRFAELKAAAESAPEKIADEATQGKVQELVKQLRVLWKQLDGTREVEKEPYAQAVTEVNGFFKTRMDPLKKFGDMLKERSEAFLKAKAEAERQRLEDEARKRREEADRAIAEAAEAERRKREAEEARRRAEREAAEAEARRREAEAQRKRAEEAARAAREEEAAMAKAREADEKRLEELRRTQEAEAAALKEAKEREARERDARREAEAKAREHGQAERQALRQEKTFTKEAEREETRAGKLQQKAEGSEAALSRTRSELGTVGTLAERWTFRIVDRQRIPLDRLRPFLNPDAIEAAVQKYMVAGNRELPGVVFEKVSEARVL